MPEILESILVIILDPIHSCWLHFVDVDRIWIGCPGSFLPAVALKCKNVARYAFNFVLYVKHQRQKHFSIRQHH